jgi:predicted transcriptional regulator
MKINFRQVEILDIARRDGKVGVEDLANRFGVTVQTIRRDLSELDAAGQLDRIHGGAVVASGTSNVAYEARRRRASEFRPQPWRSPMRWRGRGRCPIHRPGHVGASGRRAALAGCRPRHL